MSFGCDLAARRRSLGHPSSVFAPPKYNRDRRTIVEDILWADVFKCDVCGRETVMMVGGEKGRPVSDRAKSAFRKSAEEIHRRDDCTGKREVEVHRPKTV